MMKINEEEITASQHQKETEASQCLEIFKKYSENAQIIGIGMGRTMENFSHILPHNKVYVSASNQTSLFLGSRIVSSPQCHSEIDVYFDSADFVDKNNNLIKGGGGALTTEKILLKMSKKAVIVVQKFKYKESFRGLRVPVEIIKDSLGVFLEILKNRGIAGSLRLVNEMNPFLTDNGNYIVDVEFDLEFIQECKEITGVVEHGYFPAELGYSIEYF